MRLATDTGGTFTDLVVENDDGDIRLFKASTVPTDPVAGVLAALQLAADADGEDLATFLSRAQMFIHGTTHALNALVTNETALTALLVTEGHRDILVLREGGRSEPFNNSEPYPRPLVPRSLTIGIPERVMMDGAVHRELDEEAVRIAVGNLLTQGVRAIAVCLLWSIVNPAHELRIEQIIKELAPEMAVTLSHRINPTPREYRRACSAVIDASLKPIMTKYIASLKSRLHDAGFTGRVLVLTSRGGMVDGDVVARTPIQVINSGPSVAPVAGRHYALLEGSSDAIVADTGGTTYDVGLIRGGEIPVTREVWLGRPMRGHLIGFPSVDMRSVGAGGGSIAWIDNGGLLHVGPKSAGAQPGPVCYGRGGILPTVSDAALVLGFVDPDYFLGGSIRLDSAAARRSIEKNIAEPLGISIEEAAASIIEIVTENMVQAIVDITVSQGVDPARSVLIGGGGAAGLNSLYIARRLGVRSLLIPETGATPACAFVALVHKTLVPSIRSSTN
jgi:N-methylhydantoinase A